MTFGYKMAGAVRGLIISYVITMIMLFAVAVAVYKTGMSDTILNILVVAVYVIATFSGGVITGHRVQEKRFVWGAVFGVLYILISFDISALLGGYGDEATITCVTRSAMCIAGGMLGGMLSR